MTGWSDIIASAMVLIDDIRWRQDLQTSPALFYRAKADFVQMAQPMLNRPPELISYLNEGKTLPQIGEATWISTEESTTQESVVSTDWIGFELCSVSQRQADGGLVAYPQASYDAATGNVTFPVQPGAGIEYSIDLYTDGSFRDLSPAQMRLFALAVACVWDERFDRNWLNDQLKIKDASFSTISEAAYIRSTSERMQKNRAILSDELRQYEQDCAYLHRFRPVSNTTLI